MKTKRINKIFPPILWARRARLSDPGPEEPSPTVGLLPRALRS